MARTMQQPRQGTPRWIRLRCTSTAKVPSLQSMGPKCKALGAGGSRAHVRNRLLVSYDEVRAGKVNCHATQRDVEAGRTSHLCKRGNDFADTFAKKGADTLKPAFSGRQHSRCVCLPGQASGAVGSAGPRFAQVQGVERHQGCRSETTGKATASKTQAHEASGQVCDWLSPIVPTRFSQDSHLDPRTFRGHSLQLGRVFDSGGRALDRAIIFCAKCGAVYWERADALCRSCKIPGAEHHSRGFSRTNATLVGQLSTFVGPPWTRLPLWWRSWSLARLVCASSGAGALGACW